MTIIITTRHNWDQNYHNYSFIVLLRLRERLKLLDLIEIKPIQLARSRDKVERQRGLPCQYELNSTYLTCLVYRGSTSYQLANFNFTRKWVKLRQGKNIWWRLLCGPYIWLYCAVCSECCSTISDINVAMYHHDNCNSTNYIRLILFLPDLLTGSSTPQQCLLGFSLFPFPAFLVST